MTDLYNRDFALTIGPTPLELHEPTIPVVEDDKAVTTLRTTFNILRDSGRDPNIADITIYNLNLAHRQLFQKYADTDLYTWPVTVEAGYIGTRQSIFQGDVVKVASVREGRTWVTTIEASDGGKKYSSARFSKSFGTASSVVTVLAAVIAASGIGPGNALQKIATSPRGFRTFAKGVVVQGKVSDILDKYIGSCGYQWSIQDNQLQLLSPNQANGEPVVFLSSEFGLIGSPELGEKGKISFRSLLQGSIKPGRRVFIESKTATGPFVVERVSYIGDTWGNDWYAEVDGVPEKLVI